MGNSAFFSWGKFLIGWPISLISLVFIVKLILDKSAQLNINTSDVNFFYLFLGILTFFIYFLMRSFLWQFELKEKGYKIPFIQNTYAFAFSELKRYTPGNIWSFLSRAHQFSQLGIDKRALGICILADIQLVAIGSFLGSIFSIPFILKQSELQSNLSSLLPISAVAILIYSLVTGVIYKKRYGKDESIGSSLFLPGFKISSKIKLSLISIVTYFLFGVGNYFIFVSIFDYFPMLFFTLSSFFVFSLLLGYLSFITPMGLGVRELIVTMGLSQIISLHDAGVVSIFSRVVLIISELIFLLLVFIWEKSYRKK